MFNAGIFDFKSPQHTNRKEPFNYSLSVQQSLHRLIYSKVSERYTHGDESSHDNSRTVCPLLNIS